MADLDLRPVKTEDEPTTPVVRKKRRRSLWLLIGLIAAFVTYAYGYDVTEVNLDKITDDTRQQSLFRVLRALAQPDLLTYEVAETTMELDYAVPCPAGGFTAITPEGDTTFSVDPPCAEPRDLVAVTGVGFRPNDQVQVFFIPPNGTRLRLENLRTDSNGAFSAEVRIPSRPDEEVQTIQVVSKQNLGSLFSPVYVEGPDGELLRSPRWSRNAIDTLDKIIETIFLALLATTLGTFIAVPLSFFAARNLMSDVRVPPLQLGLAIAGLPIGVAAGLFASNLSRDVVALLPPSGLINGVVVVVGVWGMLRLLRVAVPVPGTPSRRSTRVLAASGATAAFLLAAQALVRFSTIGGSWAADRLGPLGFLGTFVATNGEIMAAAFGVISALAGAFFFAFAGSRLGYGMSRRLRPGVVAVLAVLAAGLAGALIALGFGQVIGWLYQIVSIRTTVVVPGTVGALVGFFVGWRGVVKGQVGSGLGIYYIARTVFNTLRSIEALVLALVFVIWVGLGPFAGALALALHTIAANAKLYSEQVESINSGPVEAVRATGATRLQTVVYAVVPQIVAPYISFTMYRWDINVRMSTIIGFVGGGGIGFLLQQNIGLLNYRAAAAQMLAIAVVVAAMDYVSSRLRERFV